MTSQVFFENATSFAYQLRDIDGNLFGQIPANGYYGLKLNYSPTFQKEYIFQVLTNPTNFFLMWMGTDGQIQRITPNNLIHLEIRPEMYDTRIQLMPPLLPYKNTLHHLHGSRYNKLLITPIDNVRSRVIPTIAPSVSPLVLILDFV